MVHRSGSDDGGSDAHLVVAVRDDVPQDVQLAFDATGLDARGHDAAGAPLGHLEDGVTDPKVLADEGRTQAVAGIEDDVGPEAPDVPVQVWPHRPEGGQVRGGQEVNVTLVHEGVRRTLPTHGVRVIDLEVLGALVGADSVLGRRDEAYASSQPRGEFAIEIGPGSSFGPRGVLDDDPFALSPCGRLKESPIALGRDNGP